MSFGREGGRPGAVFALIALLVLWPCATASALVTNDGGVLLLHVASDIAWEPGEQDPCEGAPLESWDQARTRLPADGIPRLVVLYAAFPPDSTGEVAGTCWGVRYSEQVKLWSSGSCSPGGFDLPNMGWPASDGGISVVNQPFKLALKGKPVPLYWFAVSSKEPGFLEIVPNPNPQLGGKFGNTDALAFLSPVAGYGRIGFDADGYVPEPGSRPPEGACCLDICYALAKNECDFYQGIFLGSGTTCDNDPCGPDALKGACCLTGGCEMFTLLDCARLGGVSLGEAVSCGNRPCPPGLGSAAQEEAPGAGGPAEEDRPDSTGGAAPRGGAGK